MRTEQQALRLAEAYVDGATKTEAMIAGGYSPRSASSNTNKVLPRENYRHTRFAWGLFLLGWNQTKAALYAGYKPGWCATNTTRLMRHPNVRREIRRIRERHLGQKVTGSD